MLEPRKISGFADYTEAQNAALSRWIRSVEETFRLYGFTRLIPRPLELRSVLTSRGGIEKQIFGVSRLPEDKPTELALPFDRTVPLAHWVALNAGDMTFPYKRYDVSYSFRGERAQAGRFQGFFQADVDIIGMNQLDLNADAECIAVLYEALKSLALGEVTIALNHIRLAKALLAGMGVPEAALAEALRALDKLEKQGPETTSKELSTLAGLDAAKAAAIVELFGYQDALGGFTNSVPGEEFERGMGELRTVWDGLRSLGVPDAALSFRPGVVRGLDYYTGIVFECVLTGREEFGSIAGGGRFDDLASTFTKLKLPGVGGSIGLSRLFDAACKSGLIKLEARSEAQVFVGFRTPEQKPLAQAVARALRERGVRTDLYAGKASGVGKQLAYAGKKGLPVAVMAMDEASIVVRDLLKSEQKDVPALDDAVAATLGLLRA
jgi:histidyl-tRNA synthetase